MNVEGIFALIFLIVLFSRATPWTVAGRVSDRQTWLVPGALAALTALAFLPWLSFPFLADDYVHITYARAFTAHAFVTHFTVPAGDRFFRPLGYFSYALDALWAGRTPAAWRASNLAFHVGNTLLVYLLCRALKFTALPAALGALLFGIHGSRPEAVTWIAARFDLLAVFLGLVCIHCALRQWRVASACALVLATLSKESAYVVPLLLALILWYQGLSWREIAKRSVPLLATAVLVFAYRWHLLGGVGGYQNHGQPTVFAFRFGSTLKALFLRFWGTLLFPINWTGGLELWLVLALAAAVIALGVLAWQRADRRKLFLGFAFAAVCSLPVHQFLSIGPDLEKARVLYFASVGLAILFAALAETRAWPAVILFLIFQGAALEHNLALWKRTGLLAARTCSDAAALMRADPRPVAIPNVPNVVDGVYFLHTGYPECTAFYHPGEPPRSGPPRLYEWDAQTRTIRPLTGAATESRP
jgi:hypothetical protein